MNSNNNNLAYIRPVNSLEKKDYESLIQLAIEEDCIDKDISTLSIFPEIQPATARLLSKDQGMLCGSNVFSDVFSFIDPAIKVQFGYADGNLIKPGETVAKIHGNVQNILRAERIALNFISFMSGIATKAHQAVEILRPYCIRPLDTRKTIPGYRMLSKYAVFTGGAMNHRTNLQEMGLIKDNHIAAAGNIQNAIQMFRKQFPDYKCEIEVENLSQLNEAIFEKPDMILLDNMNPALIKTSVEIIRNFNLLNQTAITSEASGGYNIENIHLLAETGVNYVSMGSLTNNIRPFDFSLEIENI